MDTVSRSFLDIQGSDRLCKVVELGMQCFVENLTFGFILDILNFVTWAQIRLSKLLLWGWIRFQNEFFLIIKLTLKSVPQNCEILIKLQNYFLGKFNFITLCEKTSFQNDFLIVLIKSFWLISLVRIKIMHNVIKRQTCLACNFIIWFTSENFEYLKTGF